MSNLIVKGTIRPLGLVDTTGGTITYLTITKKDIENEKTFKVPENEFFRHKIQEGLLFLVRNETYKPPKPEKETNEQPANETAVKEVPKKRGKKE